MWGAIAGDMIGSLYEGWPGGDPDFPLWSAGSRFTDDTVLTVAVAEAILEQRPFADSLVAWYQRYPGAGYGGWFAAWAEAGGGNAYGSFGNGGAMRVAPAGWAGDSEERVMELARASASASHDHPDGVAGAEAVALGILWARQGLEPADIGERLALHAGYELDVPLADLGRRFALDARAAESVPAAIRCFLDADSVEHAVRLAVSLGGDADTIACMAGAMAEARFGGVPAPMLEEVRRRLPPDLLALTERFSVRFAVPSNPN